MSMDIRKIQVTGGSSYMITLPKDWVESVGLRKNDPVNVQVQSDRSLSVYPSSPSPAGRSVKVIDVDGVNDTTLLYRELIGAYIAGHRSIMIVSSGRLSSTAVSTAGAFTQITIGLEITEEDDSSLTMNDLMDPAEMRPWKSLDRMKVLVRNMMSDVMEALGTGDLTRIESMGGRDQEVDRIDWLISRQVSIFQGDVALANKLGIDLIEMTRCYAASRIIERMGDHTVAMAKNTRILHKGRADPVVCRNISEIGMDLQELFLEAVGTLSTRDIVSANECIKRCEKAVDRVKDINRMALGLESDSAVAVTAIAGSVRRIIEYSIDLSELSINAAMY